LALVEQLAQVGEDEKQTHIQVSKEAEQQGEEHDCFHKDLLFDV
jgi:hypothetical protein